jgi:hypothetical protein
MPARLRRITAAELMAAIVAAIVIGLLGTGLGLAAVRVEHDQPKAPLKMIGPAEDPPTLNRDRRRLRDIVP